MKEICEQIKQEMLSTSNVQVAVGSRWEDVFKLTDQERIQAGLKLASYVMDSYTANTETDRDCRNIARAFLNILADEEVEFE